MLRLNMHNAWQLMVVGAFVMLFVAPVVEATERSRAADIYWQMINTNNAQFRYGAVKIPPQPVQPQPYNAQINQQSLGQTSQYTASNYAAILAADETQKTSSQKKALWGVISELRGGILSHDVIFPDRHDLRWPNPFRHDREQGIDINGEVMFLSPDFLEILYAPRPHMGLMINSHGDTSSAYAGFTWDGKWESGIFLEGFLGMAVHNGKLRNGNPDRIEFGSRALFRLGSEIGWRWDETHGVSLIWDHMSNAGLLSSKNQGIDNIGIRYGYNFSH